MIAEPGPSRIVTGTQIPDCNGTPVLTVHGNPDDHLRLTVLLAQALGASATNSQLREAAETCRTPTKVSWATRLDALNYLLEHASPAEDHQYAAVIVDVDALDESHVPSDELWDDKDFCRQRRELLNALLDAVADGGWLLVRPNQGTGTSWV